MKKIPTVFERDWKGDRSRVLPMVHAGCEWVLAGEGRATRKLDGTACLVQDGRFYKRREIRVNDQYPDDFIQADHDSETGKTVGWVPVTDGPEDRWHREAWAPDLADGTYELIGPKVQANREHVLGSHQLVSHENTDEFSDVPRTFEGLRTWLDGRDIEGIVFHHPNGQMAKIKLRDFGLRRMQ